MRTVSELLAGALLMVATVAWAGDPPVKDREAVQGAWIVESGAVLFTDQFPPDKHFNRPFPIPKNGHLKPQLEVKGDAWTFTFAPPLAVEPQGATRTWKVTLGSGKDVKTVDIEGLSRQPGSFVNFPQKKCYKLPRLPA
jgi:hypothetical protein